MCVRMQQRYFAIILTVVGITVAGAIVLALSCVFLLAPAPVPVVQYIYARHFNLSNCAGIVNNDSLTGTFVDGVCAYSVQMTMETSATASLQWLCGNAQCTSGCTKQAISVDGCTALVDKTSLLMSLEPY
jgi:hypothetical protein